MVCGMASSSSVNIDKLDIAQLRVFSALYEHRSVIKVSRMLDLPQPTVSRWLGRMRASFGDPLFIRTQDGMEPTPTAVACSDAVEEILNIHRTRLLNAGCFDPSTTSRNFKIAGSEFGHLLGLSRLHDWARDRAPLARVTAVPLGRNNLAAQLEQGGIDLALGDFPDLGAGIRKQALYEEGYVCVMRAGRPLSKGYLSLNEFLRAKHIVVRAHMAGSVQQEVERRLTEMLPRANVRLFSESVVAAMLMIGNSDLLLTAPARVADHFRDRCRLAVVSAPMDLPTFQVKQYWHERFHRDPGNEWLRLGIAGLAATGPARTIHRSLESAACPFRSGANA
jgi:DNA-binding transcriptional LysR family regulator